VAFALTRDEEKLCPLAGGMTGVVVRPTAADVRDTTRDGVRRGPLHEDAAQSVGRDLSCQGLGARRVRVLLVLERDGEPADVRAVTTRLRRDEPNGPGCPDTWWNAAVDSDEARPVDAAGWADHRAAAALIRRQLVA
jgi:hypothetical protein